MREPSECGLCGKLYVSPRCPICCRDELEVKRLERAYAEERELVNLLRLRPHEELRETTSAKTVQKLRSGAA